MRGVWLRHRLTLVASKVTRNSRRKGTANYQHKMLYGYIRLGIYVGKRLLIM